MRHFDTFSGYGGFTLATGEDSIGFSEVEPHAISVLKYHWPHIKNYGDINQINTADLPDFDLLTGGSPCQDLSVAGKQAGLSGERSGLFFQFIRLLKEKQPANFIWENVKGTLSSSDGWDFARVQIEMAEAGYSFQWQVLNAKYFGVPQSRGRVFVVGHLGNECGREVFFEQEDRGKNLRELGNIFAEKENFKSGKSGYAAGRVYDADGCGATLSANGGGLGGKTGLYAIPEATKQGYAVAEPGDSINLSVLGSKTRRGRVGKGVAQTLDTGMQQYTVSFVDLSTKSSQLTDTARAIQARYNKGYSRRSREVSEVMQNFRIRRLTPKECERLMGLPDDWTRYGIKSDSAQYELSDSARYKLCGNGVVVNVVKAIIPNLLN